MIRASLPHRDDDRSYGTTDDDSGEVVAAGRCQQAVDTHNKVEQTRHTPS